MASAFKVIQYEALTGPMTVPTIAELTPGVLPADTRVTRRRVFVNPGGTFAPLHVPDVTDPVPDLSWQPSYPDWIRRPLAAAPHDALGWALHIPDVTDTVPELAWLSMGESPRVRRRTRETEGGWFRAPDEVVLPDLSWSPQYPDVLLRHLRSIPPHHALSSPIHIPDVTDPVVDMSWRAVYPDRIPPKRGLPSFQHPWHVWTISTPDLVVTEAGAKSVGFGQVFKVELIQYQELTGPLAPTPPGVVTPDDIASLGYYPAFVRRRRNVAPYIWAEQHFPVIINVPVMSWTGEYLTPPVRRRRIAQQGGRFEPPWSVFIATIVGWGRLLSSERNRLVRGA